MASQFTKMFKVLAKDYLQYISNEAAGFLYKLLASLHYHSFFLVKNIDEDLRIDKEKSFFENLEAQSFKDNVHMNICDLVALSGADKRTVERYIKELIDARILAKVGRGKNSRFQLNPDLFSRQSSPCPYATSIAYKFAQITPPKKIVRKLIF